MMTVGLITVLVFLLSGCESDQSSHDAAGPPSAIERLAIRREQPDPLIESQIRGRLVYEQYCLICHGSEARGDGFNSAMLNPPPRNFADAAFWKQADDVQLQKVIALGGKAAGKSVLMPEWGRTINESQIQDVIAFLRTAPELAKQADAEEAKNESDDEE